MKKTKGIITIILIIFYSFCKGQAATTEQKAAMQRRSLEYHQEAIKMAAYIFEGTVIQQKCYYAKHRSNEIFTCSVVQITKIFKGSPQLKLGSIKVITYQGGRVGNGPSVQVDDANGIGRGRTYIIFGIQTISDGQPLDSNALKSMVTDNIFMPNCIDHIDFIGKDAVRWEDSEYKTHDELYSYLKENGLTVQEEADSAKQK